MSNISIACLGPTGTHSEVALRESGLKFDQALLCRSIHEVFDKVSKGQVSSGLVPIENFIEGPVSETLDQLANYKNSVHISQSLIYQVRHAIAGLKDLTKNPPSAIYSHPQALGQCSDFLHKNFPAAARCAVESSAAAIELVKKNKMKTAAVIALKETLEQRGFHIHSENISDKSNNRTRFILIKPGQAIENEQQTSLETSCITSILVEPAADRTGLLFELLSIISKKNSVNIKSIHSRPDQKGGFLFFLDLEGQTSNSDIKKCLQDLREIYAVDSDLGTKIIVTGTYNQTSFETSRSSYGKGRKVGIIGAAGQMGMWFSNFFRDCGYDVIASDKKSNKNSKTSSSALAEASEIIVLSVPMSAMPEVVADIKDSLKPGTLVVENCSIKESALPLLLGTLPKNIEVLGIHTMFGGQTEKISGENIILTPTNRSGVLSKELENLLYRKGASLSIMQGGKHDSTAALMQGLVHLLLIAFGSTCAKSGLKKEDFTALGTPNSRAISEALQRVISQSDELLLDLQLKNSSTHEMRGMFLQQIFALVFSLKKEDPSIFQSLLRENRQFFTDLTK